MGSIFTIFRHLTELWVSFSGDFHNFQNYGPDFHSIYGIITLKSTRIYGIMGANFSGKIARPCQKIGEKSIPPVRRVFSSENDYGYFRNSRQQIG